MEERGGDVSVLVEATGPPDAASLTETGAALLACATPADLAALLARRAHLLLGGACRAELPGIDARVPPSPLPASSSSAPACVPLQAPSGQGRLSWWPPEETRREAGTATLHALAALGATALAAQARAGPAERAQRLLSLSSALGGAATPDEVVRVVVEVGVGALGAHAGAVAALDPADGHVTVLGSVGYPDELKEMFQSVPLAARTPLTDAVRERAPILLEGPQARALRYPHLARAREVNGGGAMAALPLDLGATGAGALGLSFPEPRAFSPDDRAFLLVLARLCGQALERARLFDAERTARAEAETARSRLALLLDASTALSAPLGSQAALDTLAALAVQALADACTVYLREGDFLVPRAMRAAREDLARRTRETQERHPHDLRAPGGLSQVYRNASPLVVPRITDEMLVAAARGKDHLEDLRALGLRSSMVLPLWVAGEVAGVLVLSSTREDREYGPADLALAGALARRASLALENARLLEAARDAEARLENLVRSVPGLVWETWGAPREPSPRIGFVSRHVEQMLGYTPEEWLAAPDFWLRVVHPEDRADATQAMQEAFERGGVVSHQSRWVGKDGRVLHVLTHAVAARDEQGRPVGMRGVTLDVTERRLAEERLHLYRRIFLASRDAIAVIDAEGRYVEQNDAHHRLVGYSDEELAGKTPAVHLDAEDFEAIRTDLLREGHSRGEHVSRAKSGERVHLDLSAFTVHDAQGRVAYHVGIKRDITRRKQVEADLRDRVREVEAIYRMTDNLARATREEQVHAAALDCVSDLLDAPQSAILLYDAEGELRFTAWRNLSSTYRAAVEGHSPWPRDAQDPPVILVEDVEADPSMAPFLDAFHAEGIGALAFLPIAHHGRLLGKLMVYHGQPHAFTPSERRRAATIASNLAFGIVRVQAEERVRASEARLSTIVGSLAEGIMLFDAEGRVVLENAAARRLMGERPRGVHGVEQPDARAPGAEDILVSRVLARGEPARGEETLVRRPDGTHVALSVNAVPIHDAAGRVAGVAASFMDVTERKASERALRESEERFRTLAEVVPEIVWTADAAGAADYFNPRWFGATGLTLDESLGDGWLRALHPDDEEGHLAAWRRCLAEGEAFEAEHRIRTAEGDHRWHLARAAPLRDAQGRVAKWFGSLTDIHDRKAAEEDLRRSELWLRSIFDSLDETVLVITYPELVISNANLGLEKVFGYAREEVLGRSTRLLHVDDAHFAEYGRRIAEAFARGEPARFEFTVRRKDGTTFPSQQTVSLLKGTDGKALGGLCVVRDLTEEKRAQAELESARRQVATTEKLSALGSLVSGVAHEIRTPLAYITNHLFLIQQRLERAARSGEDPALLHEDVSRHGAAMMEGVDRINRIVGELRRFTRLKAGERAQAPLDLVVLEAVDLFRATHKGRMGVETDLQPTPALPLDRVQVQQVVLNLLDNGADSMGRVGTLRVATRPVEGGAELVIVDAGPGIPLDVQARMFDPLFTTKKEGTGLGLSIVRRIVETHGGSIRFESAPGKGTAFYVLFPAEAGPAAP